MAQMGRNRMGIALAVDDDRRLVGTVTDGDVRRGILAGVDLGQPVRVLLERKAGTQFARPITTMIGQNPNRYLELLKEYKLLHLPLVDESRRLVALVAVEEFLPDQALPLQAVVMAGGKGIRLRPLTDETPMTTAASSGR